MMKRLTVLLFHFWIFGFTASAQQQAQFTQYMFNGLALNPAYAGSHESISATALSRIQWVGIEGAPNTNTLSIHSPVPNKNIAVGAIFSRDEIGVSTDNSLFFSYAYRIKFSRSTILSMGLQGGFRQSSINYGELGINDPNLASTTGEISPNFGVGLYLYTNTYYVGVSSPRLFRNTLNVSDNNDLNEFSTKEIPHYFITSGMVFELNPVVKIKPSILLKSVGGAPLEMDINANVILDDKVWLGLSYRSFDSFSFLFDLQASPQLRFGYAYDYTLTDLKAVTSGSHELMVNYRFVFSKNKVVTPRYF
ncbi:MAG: type IX secretion system membrane protein PorP/SprF [Cyclobacteriaceae bacterium]